MLPTRRRASVRALFYCYLTFLDHRTNTFQNCHLDKTKHGQNITTPGEGFNKRYLEDDDLPDVEDGAGELLLVGEGQLDRREGDVEALDEALLAEGQHHRPVGVRRQAGRDEAPLHLVVDLVLRLI